MGMKPLEHSWAADDLEAELRALFIKLYTDTLGDKADEINVYGAPHIGPFSLIEREVAKDGLAVLRTTDEEAIRHLFRSWRFRNPRRGTHFLRTYLKVLFGNSFEVAQLWQPLDQTYPTGAIAKGDRVNEELDGTHFLTSRIRVDIDAEYVPTQLTSVLRTTVAARFVMDVRTAKYGESALGAAGVGVGSSFLIGANVSYPWQWLPHEKPLTGGKYGSVSLMLASLWNYIVRATGANAAAAGMPHLITGDGLVRNAQFVGTALGGYMPDGASTSEGMSLLMRGIAHAYKVDRDPSKLAYLKFLMDASCKYFFFGARPTNEVGQEWYHTWLVNAGAAFNVRGPLAANGKLDEGGYIGQPVVFTGGQAQLNPAPDIVYQVVTNGTVFTWVNVFSEIEPGTGQAVEVDYYVDAGGNKVYGTQKGGSFGQPIEANSGLKPGLIVLKEQLSGTYLVNYSVTVPNVKIEYGDVYEAWPMWRHLQSGERAMAADAIHWYIDAFRLLVETDPSNLEWKNALDRLLESWQLCCTQDSDNSSIFLSGAKGPYNNFPLTYAYAYGVENVDDESTHWEGRPPSSAFTAERTSDGYVTFVAPEVDAAIGSGGRKRYGLAFENRPVYLSYTQESFMYIDTKASIDLVLTMTITDEDGEEYDAAVMATPSSEPVLLTMNQFMKFTSEGQPSPRWIPGERIYDFNHGVTRTLGYLTMGGDRTLMAETFVIPDSVSGFGVTFDMVSPFLILTVPPKVCYLSSSAMTLTLKDQNDWLWAAPAPQQSALAERSWTWADFTLSSYQEPTNDGKPLPSAPTGTLKVFQFTGAEGVHGAGGNTPQSISIAYISAVTPVSATSGGIRKARILDHSATAHTWKVGDVVLNNGKRSKVNYVGALPFALMIGGPGRSRLSSVPFRGPYIAGYQSGTPWVDLNNERGLGAMLDFMSESQVQFQNRSPAGLLGPFMHCYLPAVWDSEQYGDLDSWVWDGPDGNATWQGWQYRAFDAMAATWRGAVDKGMSALIIEKAGTVCTRFLDWIYGWLFANPKTIHVPSNWAPPGWGPGSPLEPNAYLDPHGNTVEPHDLALVLKGAIYCALAGADAEKCKSVIERTLQALALSQVRGEADPMRGAFTLNPADFESYGFHQGEIMDALALACLHPELLPEANRDSDEYYLAMTDGTYITTASGIQIVSAGAF